MAVDTLRVQVLFAAIDKLTGPLKGMAGGSKGLKAELASTRKEILALQNAQGQAGGFKAAERKYAQTAKDMSIARNRAEALRKELDKLGLKDRELARDAAAAGNFGKGYQKVAKDLQKLEAAEKKAALAHEQQGQKVQELGRKLEAAGVDVTKLGEHEERLGVKLYGANRRLEQQQRALERNAQAQARWNKVQVAGQKIASVGMGLTFGLTVPLVYFAKKANAAALESSQAAAQVSAALASMGAKSGRTMEQLKAQAAGLQSTSLFDDDDIMRKVTANLLTFGQISGPVFDRAQQDIVDMATRLKMDLQPATVLVGKALNDPASGLMALSRVGAVSKEWAKANKPTLEQLVKTGQTAKAQAMLLNELEKQFRGSARAARAADPMADAAENWRTFQENVGALVDKVLPRVNAALAKLLGWFNGLSPAMQETIGKAAVLAIALGPVLMIVGKLASGIAAMRKAWLAFQALRTAGTLASAAAAVAPFLGIIAVVAVLGVAAYLIWKHWDTIKAAFGTAWQWLSAKFEQFKSFFMRFPFLFGPIGVAVAFVVRHWTQIKGAFSAGLAFLTSLASKMLTIGAQIIDGLINGITGRLAALKSAVVNTASSAAKWFKDKLGIRSPSRVFMAFGGHITEGLRRGIAAGEGAAVKRVDKLSSRVAGALAASSLVASPALAGVGSRMGAPASSSRAAAASPAPLGPITIQIYQQAGQSADELARLVAGELRKLQASANRSAYHDE